MSKYILLIINLLGLSAVVLAQPDSYSSQLSVAGACGMCAERIQNAALAAGADSARWDGQTQTLFLIYDSVTQSLEDISHQIASVGHDTELHMASDSIYMGLHECCHYREYDDYIFAEAAEAKQLDHDHVIRGRVYERKGDELVPLYLANISVPSSSLGTTTDEDGYFELDPEDLHVHELEVSFIGFKTQSFEVEVGQDIEVILEEGVEFGEIKIISRKRSNDISLVNTLQVESINEKELSKAACCNLGECFETNPSLEALVSNAVTGIREIRMLGLTGAQIQFTEELIPSIRGLSSSYGLLTTPGPWIENIQIIKGSGSVVHGFESVTGQVNLELRKSNEGERLFVNGFTNQAGRYEGNVVARSQLSEYVSTSVLIHARSMQNVHDNNDDDFTDMPLENLITVANRWMFERQKNFMGQLGLQVSQLEQESGTLDYFNGISSSAAWRMDNQLAEYKVWGKLGYVFGKDDRQSFGLRTSVNFLDQEVDFGNRSYQGDQWSVFSSLTYLHDLDDGSSLSAGISYQSDNIEERIDDLGPLSRDEQVWGAFAEYSHETSGKWTFIPSARIDHHNSYGWMFVPRLHTKYQATKTGLLRLSAGRSWRTTNLIAENLGFLASSRQWSILGQQGSTPYGLDAERAWNYGLSWTQELELAGRDFLWSIDFFRTHFDNQVIVDREDPDELRFYNLDGQSYSNSLQWRADYEILDRLDLRVAYRMFDVQKDFQTGRLREPLVSQHRAFVNLAYETENGWGFDMTYNWVGEQRLPSTEENPAEFKLESYTPSYSLLNAQISKSWSEGQWELYLGGGNLTNYRQQNAILDAENPFGEFFDASFVWAPLFGTNIYAGFRFRLE